MAVDKITEKINQYISKHPEYRGKSEDVVLSAMVKSGVVTKAEIEGAKKGSAFGEGFHNDWGMGVTLERNTQPSNLQQENNVEKTVVDGIEITKQNGRIIETKKDKIINFNNYITFFIKYNPEFL